MSNKVIRRGPTPEQVFYDSVYNLVKNMFTKANPNFNSRYYALKGGFEFQREVERMAEFVLSRMEDWKHLIEPFNEDSHENDEYQTPSEQKILWEEEQIPAEKRDTLKSLGLQQLFVHKTFVHMPGMDYSQIPLIPTSTFFTPDRKYEFYWLFLDDTLRWMTNRGDAEKTYFTWEEGLEFIKKVMTNAN